MSRISNATGPNLRLLAVLALTGLAVGSTIVGSAASEEALLSDDPTSSSTSSPIDTEIETVVDDAPDLSSTTTATAETTAADTAVADDGIDVVVVGGTGNGTAGAQIVVGDEEPAASAEVAGDELDGGVIAAACEVTAPAEAEQADDAFHVEDFSVDAAAWDALSGSWSVVDGEYHQVDGGGYDLISQLRVDPPDRYRVSVTLRPLEGPLGGGLILAQPLPAERAGATIVDFTDGGSFLRWGKYDDNTGQYQYLGGVAMSDDFDPAAGHELTVEVRDERTMVMVDGVEVGSFDPLPFGRLGLVTSRSPIAFDTLRIVEVGR